MDRLENASSIVNTYDNLRTAANINLDIINSSLPNLLEYRKRLAIEVLSNNEEEKKKELTEMYFYIDCKIKALLGLK